MSTFVKKDINILSKNYNVSSFNFEVEHGAKWKIFFVLIRQIYFLISHSAGSRLYICQFSGYHSFLPALFANLSGKKCLLIAAGMDCVSFPSIRYGNFYRPFLKRFTGWSYQLASHIAPKHETLWHCKYTYTASDYPEQGIHFFLPHLNKPYTVIPNGYDSIQFHNVSAHKEKKILTVTGAMEYSFQTALKGIDLILEVAPHFPDYTFTIVGALSEDQFKNKSENVKVLPKIPNEKLIELYSQSLFYFQLSMAEGFPNALCEAMLCECTPVGSDVFSIPEIIGDTGFVLAERNPHMLIELIQKAIASDTVTLGKKARERIAGTYSLEFREKKLNQLVKELIEEK